MTCLMHSVEAIHNAHIFTVYIIKDMALLSISIIQCLTNIAVHIVMTLRKFNHITPAFKDQHWIQNDVVCQLNCENVQKYKM